MNRLEVERYVADQYGIVAENPFGQEPTPAVFRHPNNRKWFAIIMELPYAKLGLAKDGVVDVINVKCDPLLIGSLIGENGIHPAYHMNKNHWITIRLDDSVKAEKVCWLLDLSFALTNVHRKRKGVIQDD